MQFSLSILALAACLLSTVSAKHSHADFHRKRDYSKPMVKRELLTANSQIQTLAANPDTVDVVEGADGSKPFQNTLVNNSTEDAKVYFWDAENFAIPYVSWANPNPAVPALIVDLPAGAQKVVSFTYAFSGAYAAVFPGTGIGPGGGFKTAWVELTTSQSTPVVDVSMLPDMTSKFVSVETDHCVSDVTTCSFQCNKAGQESCWLAGDCELMNCAQTPYNVYSDGGGAGPWNGGCLISSTFTTTFSGSQ